MCKKSKEVQTVQGLFFLLSVEEKRNFLKNSNLTIPEQRIMFLRYLEEMSCQEVADHINATKDCVDKRLKLIHKKLYVYIIRRTVRDNLKKLLDNTEFIIS